MNNERTDTQGGEVWQMKEALTLFLLLNICNIKQKKTDKPQFI